MTWLITGGAGYIGAHVARAMAEAGERVVVLDDLSTGVPERLPAGVPLVEGSTLDRALLDRLRQASTYSSVEHADIWIVQIVRSMLSIDLKPNRTDYGFTATVTVDCSQFLRPGPVELPNAARFEIHFPPRKKGFRRVKVPINPSIFDRREEFALTDAEWEAIRSARRK